MTPNALWLTNDALELGIDCDTGAIIGLRTADGRWSICRRPHLGLSFRLLVPLEGRRFNVVDGLRQRPPQVRRTGAGVVLRWDSVRSEHGGEHAIAVECSIALEAHGALFSIDIDNQAEVTVENVHFPFLGDLQPPDRDREFSAVGGFLTTARRTTLWPQFENAMGFCSVERPTFANVRGNTLGAVGAPSTPFLLLEDGTRGLYWGVAEPSSELVVWHGELQPGWGDSLDSYVPPGETLDGHDVAIRFGAVHVPYISPGERRRLTPIALEPYVGDWHAGADLYAARRRLWMDEPTAPEWATEPHSWQQIQLNSAEDSLRVRFDQLPEIARECADRGVTALQVVGWNVGGQDRNNPSHDPDPRLGGETALRSAIAECQAIGVKVVLFTKFVWADRASERFRTELEELAVKDPYGDYYVFPGFRYDTVTQLLDINTRRLIPMCFQSERWLDLCAAEFAKVVELGADGMLNDEALHHSPALLCFDTSHGHRLGAPVYARDRDFVRRLQAGPGADRPDFLYAAEACYDWLFEVYPMAYHRSNSSEHVALARYLRPHVPIMTAITGFDDRNMINQCLLYRYIASYEPFLFKGRLTDFDRTIDYGRRMDAVRTELREWFWDGTFRDTVGATVTDQNGDPHHPYAVYTSVVDGVPAAAIANYRDTASDVTVEFAGSTADYRYRSIEDGTWHDVRPVITVPARSAVVVIPA